MPRVLVVTTIDRTLAGHVQPLREMGLEVELACRSTSKVAAQRLEELGLPRHEVAFARKPLRPTNIKALWQLRRILRQGRYAVLDAHTPVAAWLTRLAARLFSTQSTVIYTAHGFHFHSGQHPLRNAVFVALEKAAGRWTDYLVVINREDEAAARRYRIVPAERVRYIPGAGVDTVFFDPRRVDEGDVSSTRQALGLGEEEVLFLSIGEFTGRKRHADGVSALARLGSTRAHLAFAGDGPLIDQVRTLASRLGVVDRTHFLGYRTDITTLIRACRATMLTSRSEGVPKCVMESLALEVPAIGTNVRGTRELLEGGCGILVPLGDVEAVAKAMRWMMDHPEEAAEMGRRGRRKVQGAYELRNVLQHTEALYRRVLHLTANGSGVAAEREPAQ